MFIKQGLVFRRCGFYLAGLLLIAFGVAFSINSNLGISPVTSLPYVSSLVLGIPLSAAVIAVYLAFIAIQFLLQPKAFRLWNLAEVVCAVVFGFFADFAKWTLRGLTCSAYPGRLALLGVSMVLIAAGVSLYLDARLLPMPMEGMQLAFARRFRMEFGRMKILVDTAAVLLSIALSLAVTGRVQGIREGTVLSALAVGKLVSLVQRWIRPRVERLCFPQGEEGG